MRSWGSGLIRGEGRDLLRGGVLSLIACSSRLTYFSDPETAQMFKRMECGFCGGTGKCTWCQGSGLDAADPVEPQCLTCSGTGRCHECKGRGKAPSVLHDLWIWFWTLRWDVRRLVVASAVGIVLTTVVFWKVMVPLIGVAIVVTVWLRLSRARDSL